MIIIFGTRWTGRVDEQGGECAETLFAHLFYLPIVPLRSIWVIGGTGSEVGTQVRASALVVEEFGDRRFGLPIRLHARSVAAAFLRVWGVVVAVACFAVSPSIAMGVVAAGVAALSVWSWSWRTPRGQDRRHGDLRLLAFGTRCDPNRLGRAARERLRTTVHAQRAGAGAQRPAEDVARFGPTSLNEAVVAYGQLIVDQRAQLAERIALGQRDLPNGAGPYRDAPAPLSPETLRADLGREADALVGTSLTPWIWERPYARPFAVGLMLGLAALGFAVTFGAWRSAPLSDGATLARDPPLGDYIAVACDRITDADDPPPRSRDLRVAACALGSRRLVLVAPLATPISGTLVAGTLLRHVEELWAWGGAAVSDPEALQLYLEIHRRDAERAWALAFVGLGTFALGLGLFWTLRGPRSAWRTRARSATS